MKTIAYIAMVVTATGLTAFIARDIVTDFGSGDSGTGEFGSDSSESHSPKDISAHGIEGDVNELSTLNRIEQLENELNAQTDRLDQTFASSPATSGDAASPFHIDPIEQSESEIPLLDAKGAAADASPDSAEPIRQQTSLHSSMITPGNFVYLGGFRPEFGDGNRLRFGYGGRAIAYRPDGDADGPDDGFPGSLYLMGHKQQQMIAEIDIPKPFLSIEKNINQLPQARTLQPFADITKGIRKRLTNGSSEPFEIGGMQVIGNRLHWTVYKYYNVEQIDHLSHGLTSTTLSSQAYRGLWHLGPINGGKRWHSYKNAGYIAEIPQPIADRYLDGMNLMSGLQISTGRQQSSQGPALYAYKVVDENLPNGGSLDAVPLLWYPMNAEMTGHHPADIWRGAAWLTLGDKQAVIIVGRKGLGPVHYGQPRANECYDYKGYHASRYEAQVLFYQPEQILAGARQSVPNKDPWYRWNDQTPGGGIDRFMYQECGREIGGIAYDRARNLLYVSEADAAIATVNEYEPLPVIHVFRLVD